MSIDWNVIANAAPLFAASVAYVVTVHNKVNFLETELRLKSNKLDDTQSMLHEILNRIIKLETIIEQKFK